MTDQLRNYLDRSSYNRGLFLLLLVFTGASLFSFVGFTISELFLGIPLLSKPNLLDNFSDPELLPALRLMQILQAFGMMIIPSVVYLALTRPRMVLASVFGSTLRQPVLLSIVFFMVAFPLVNYLADWNATWELPTVFGEWLVSKESQAGSMTQMLLDMPNFALLSLNLLMIGFLPALGEELIFRGILQPGLTNKIGNPHLAIWLTAIIFSAVHFQILGFVPRMLMGVAMGYLFFWSGNLWYPIIAHLTNNCLAVLLSFGGQNGFIQSSMENAGTGNQTLAAFSLIFCLMLLFLFKEFFRSQSLQK